MFRDLHRLFTLLIATIALTTACATTSPVLNRVTEPVPTVAPSGDEASLEIRKGNEHEADATLPAAGTPECLDAAFLGSPDARPEGHQIPLPCWRAVLSTSPRVAEDVARAVSSLNAQRSASGEPQRADEAGVCLGLTQTEVALSPFYFKEDIVEVSRLTDGFGARVRFDAVPSLTVERMKKVVDCHLARAHVLCDPASSDACPLVLGQVSTHVHIDGGQVMVDIEGKNAESGDAILERLETLRPQAP